jgi:hypothetical protein
MAGDQRWSYTSLYSLAVIPVLSPHESLLDSLLRSLLDSLLGNLLHSLLESLIERATLREEKSFPQEAFGRSQTLSL